MNSVSDHRWHELKSTSQRAIYWENLALQLRAERDLLLRENERLARTIAQRDRQLSLFLFRRGDQPHESPTRQERGTE